ncbi:MAG: SpoIID/LytB domain-containing protein [Bacteroidia bacterium]|nr:SpoIID/LytB domain-containing protein [Bacteroidia bacterium]MDW8347594.1 SpoIID/LytB domain-containing protein [Bacteroidia bacterium]
MQAREVKIGLWSDILPQSVRYHSEKHEVWLLESTYEAQFKRTIFKDSPFSIRAGSRKVEVYQGSEVVEVFDTLYIYPNAIHAEFTLKNASRSGSYKGKLITFVNAQGFLTLINEVHIEWYLCGVVESELGRIKQIEALKAQALCARTYAIRGYKRHIQEGFHLCDQQHCQAYKGVSGHKLIVDAVFSTRGEVIMYQGALIDALFSACCGGVTADAQEVWNKEIPYLKPVLDGKYCQRSKNFRWTVVIPLTEWRKVLFTSDSLPSIWYYLPDQSGRSGKIMYRDADYVLSDHTMRAQLRLKSAKIKYQERENCVIIEGYGFGHGVGLCQEGAIGMASQGFTYQNIIKYYYTGVTLGYDTEEE